MTQAANDVLTAAMALDERERAEIAERLWRSLDGDDEPEMSEAEFDAELDRRIREADEDPSILIPWEEAQKRLRPPQSGGDHGDSR